MNSFWDYTVSNNFRDNFFLPQMNFWAGNTGYNFNAWQAYTKPIYIPNIFDFSYNHTFSFPSFNFQLPVFQMPQITYTAPPEVNPKAEIAQNIEEELEPVETDNEIQVKKVESKKAKTRESNIRNAKYPIISEEIVPGYYVNKGKGSNTKDLKPYMKETLIKLDKKAKELGYTLVVVDGFRSHEAQIAAKKRKPKLCATPGKSAHEYGVAVDLALYKDGKKVEDIYRSVPEFGRYAQSIGLEWGATWKTKYEPWHFNMNDWTALADVRDEYRSYNHLA